MLVSATARRHIAVTLVRVQLLLSNLTCLLHVFKGSTYSSLEELVGALKYGEVDGILVDAYTAHYRDDLFNTSWIQVSQIIPYEFTSGAVISGTVVKLERHFRDLIAKKRTQVTKILQETNEDKEVRKTIETHPGKSADLRLCSFGDYDRRTCHLPRIKQAVTRIIGQFVFKLVA